MNKKLHRIIELKPKIITDYELNEIECYVDFNKEENFCLLLRILLDNDMDVAFHYKRNKEHKSLCEIEDVDGIDIVDALINWFEITEEYFECEGVYIKYLELKNDLKKAKWVY